MSCLGVLLWGGDTSRAVLGLGALGVLIVWFRVYGLDMP